MKSATPKLKRSFLAFRILINLLLLLCTVIVVLQNTQTISIRFLWAQIDAPLALLLFCTGSVASVITLFFLLRK
ncbi:MAG: LapA family protein [Saprospiraceae bacterium]|nr:LapA family protein [Saprospiraceae bacterium]